MASAKKRTKPGHQSLPDDATRLTGEPATDRALLELAEVLAEIAHDVVRLAAVEHESQSSEGKHDDR